MDHTIIAALIGVLGGLLGAWIGGIISRKSSREAIAASNKNAIDIMRRQKFNKAASDFKAAFFDIINPDGMRVQDILKELIVEHERAKIVFSANFATHALHSLNKAWVAYYSQENRNAEHLFEYKSVVIDSSHNIDTQHEIKVRKLALSRIENLLSFAKYK